MPTTELQKADGWRSITEILDYFQEPELVAWRVKVGLKEANKISRLAAKTGSRVHELIYSQWMDGDYKLKSTDNSEVRSCMEAWERFRRDYNPQIISMEDELKHEHYKLIGHQDIRCIVNGERRIDIKTAGDVRLKHWLQLGGYELCEPLYLAGILRLDRNIGTYEYVTSEEAGYTMIDLSDTYKQLVKVYDFFNPRPYGTERVMNDNSNSTKDSPTYY